MNKHIPTDLSTIAANSQASADRDNPSSAFCGRSSFPIIPGFLGDLVVGAYVRIFRYRVGITARETLYIY